MHDAQAPLFCSRAFASRKAISGSKRARRYARSDNYGGHKANIMAAAWRDISSGRGVAKGISAACHMAYGGSSAAA